jgi:hypothetical protein
MEAFSLNNEIKSFPHFQDTGWLKQMRGQLPIERTNTSITHLLYFHLGLAIH